MFAGLYFVLTLPLRYWFIADIRKMYNLLTLVDRLHFICKRKRKSISVTKNKKKSLLWLKASYLYRKIILSGREVGRSRAASSLRLGSLGGGLLRWHDDEYLSFINKVFLNITKHWKLALFIEKYNSLSKKTMNEHITDPRERERERESERAREFFIAITTIIVESAWTAVFPPPWFPIN